MKYELGGVQHELVCYCDKSNSCAWRVGDGYPYCPLDQPFGQFSLIPYKSDQARAGEGGNRSEITSAVEKFVMPQLLNDFPEFNVAAAIDRVKSDAALFYRSAIENKVLFSDNSTTALLENLILPKDVKGNIIIHKAALSAYNKLGHDRILTYQASAEYMDTSDTRNQKRLILKYIAASDDDFSQNIHTFTCPNCGAPVPTIGDKVCKYCGIALQTSTSLGWYLMDIREG